jgi:hypothetical protein
MVVHTKTSLIKIQQSDEAAHPLLQLYSRCAREQPQLKTAGQIADRETGQMIFGLLKVMAAVSGTPAPGIPETALFREKARNSRITHDCHYELIFSV